MADSFTSKALPLMQRLQATQTLGVRDIATLRPELAGAQVFRPGTILPTIPRPTPPQPVPAPPPQPAPPILPRLSPDNPFNQLPRPSPGDRIRADDFKQLANCLDVVLHAFTLSAALFGRPLGEARAFLAAEGLTIRRLMTVFGTAVDGPGDASFDTRRVVQVLPAPLGEPEVFVLLSEAVDTRRLAPNLTNLTHAEATDRLRGAIGEGTFPVTPVRVPSFVGGTVTDAAAALSNLPR